MRIFVFLTFSKLFLLLSFKEAFSLCGSKEKLGNKNCVFRHPIAGLSSKL